MRDLIEALDAPSGIRLGGLKNEDSTTFHSGSVYVHVWFDSGVAKTDAGKPVPNSGEFQVIASTSEDPLNLKPRGQVLARKEFRYADPKNRDLVVGAAQDFVRDCLFKYRKAS
ncbi:hypothetical protein UFOVP1382_43 [uncultured Caudovirales phage]|uniref:Uncharacterized protein n=1 Tax=uncultured Caudovirales phage TaxID=2100421 RepID=A0A6J5S3S1_9CAUD|nr:hypothetical protein UFOVP1382_43 [uncultured Caudovirales phage]